jgi:DNA modification methylase
LSPNNKVMNLIQDRLNVTQKKRSNLFNWRGQFTPEFVEYILKQFSNLGDLVIDPFSGSGTVLQEATLNEVSAQGFEINPSAYAMSKFFTFANDDLDTRWAMLNQFEIKLNSFLQPLNGQKIFTDHTEYRTAYQNLIMIGEQVLPSLDKKEKILWLNMLFLSERDKNLSVRQSVQKSFMYIKNALIKLPHTEQLISAHLRDARDVGKVNNANTDLIITSPPYINVFNYHQNYRALVEIMNFDILKVAHSEFGSNRKNRGNRFKTVVQYALDMEQAIRSFWDALKFNGTLILVLGRQSNVRNTPFYNGQIVSDILKATNGFEEINTLERHFTNKFGNDIKEDILIFRKTNEMCLSFHAKEIAYKHMENSLLDLEGDIRFDLEEAMKSIDIIEPSPIFNSNQILTYA